MGWFSKKEKVQEIEKVPEIPPVPELPEIPVPPKSKNESSELPSLPQNLGENLNTEIVKSAVSDESHEEPLKVEELPKDFKEEQEKNTLNQLPPKPEVEQQPHQHPQEKRTLELTESISNKMTKKEEPIFVRFDKFQEAKKDFKQIKKQIKEIENVLRKIEAIKSKEDEEISKWINNIEKVKSRLAEIDANIFNKL